MFDDTPFFSIPIYRCSEKQYLKELEEERERLRKFFKSSLPETLKNTYDVGPLVERSLNWKCWKYNEIIGFIELYILGSQIRGSLFFIESKRIRKDIKKKKIVYLGKVFESSIHNLYSIDIFKLLMEELNRVQISNSKLKNRYVDVSGIMKIGPHVDWKELVKNNR
ncbi:MAG: hypothetical protein WCK88_07015 [bacterium]